MRTIDEILADMQTIMDKAELTADDLLSYQALELELAQAQEAAAPDEAEEEAAGGAEPEPTPAPAAAVARAPRAAVADARARHAAATRVVVPRNRPSSRKPETEMDGFRAYLRTGVPNADMRRAPQNAQTTGTGSSGGFLVPEGFLTRIVEVIKTFGGVFNDAEQITTDSGNPLPFPTNDDTANQAVVATENNAPGSGADATFGQVQLGAFEYAASGASGNALAIPIALVQDSAIDIEAFIARILGRRIARKMGTDAVTGTGSGQAQGVLQGLSGVATGATTLDYSDLVDLAMSVDAYYWPGAKWYMNQTSLGKVLELEDTSGQLIFKPGFLGMIGDVNATQIQGAIQIGGLLTPVVVDPAFSTFADQAKWAVFGDLNEGLIWRTVRQIEVLVDPYSSANKRQINYNAFVRADGRQKNTSAYAVSKGGS